MQSHLLYYYPCRQKQSGRVQAIEGRIAPLHVLVGAGLFEILTAKLSQMGGMLADPA